MKCSMCNGDGSWYNAVLWDGPGGGEYIKCYLCNGEGKISLLLWILFKWRSR